MAALVDTNVLVYRHDPRFPEKQRKAASYLRWGIEYSGAFLAHQALVEFVAVTTRPTRGPEGNGQPLLSLDRAQRIVEELMLELPVLYPNEDVVATAIKAAASYRLSWYDAHMLAYAQVFGLPELASEDFEHDRFYGNVRIVNPFLAAETIHQTPARYGG